MILRHYHGGSATKLTPRMRQKYGRLELAPHSRYLILLSRESALEDNYSSAVHELGHIFCGHLGVDPEVWWRDRQGMGKTEMEIEAESVSFLVCRRQGLLANSGKVCAKAGIGRKVWHKKRIFVQIFKKMS